MKRLPVEHGWGSSPRRRRVARGLCGAPAVRLGACAAAPRGARGAERGCLHSQRSFLALRVRARAGKSQALPGRCGPGTGNAARRAVSCNHDGGGTGCEARMS